MTIPPPVALMVKSLRCANGETICWTLNAGDTEVAEIYCGEEVGRAEATKRLIGRVARDAHEERRKNG